MRNILFILGVFYALSANAAEQGVLTRNAKKSFLTAQSFPSTFSDVPFADKMAVKAEGYDRFSTLSAYEQIELKGLHEELAKQISEDVFDEKSGDDSQDNDKKNDDNLPVSPKRGYCAQKHPNIPSNQKIPFGSPVLHEHFVYCAPYGIVDRGSGDRVHQGYDIGCTLESFGRPVFVPADGIVSLVKKNRPGGSAGNYVVVDHENGFKTYYLHLDKIFVSQGQRVSAGCQIATIGNTGASKETKKNNGSEPYFSKSLSHVHYEMTYTGNQTSVSVNGKTLAITHGWPNSQTQSTRDSIDPTQFICVYANFTTGYCGKKFPYL